MSATASTFAVFRRALLLIPTLIGIVLVGFVITCLAGVPDEEENQRAASVLSEHLARPQVQRLRRLLRLDLPLLLNTAVEDRDGHPRALLERLLEGRSPEENRKRLLRLGPSAWPALADAWDEGLCDAARLRALGLLIDERWSGSGPESSAALREAMREEEQRTPERVQGWREHALLAFAGGDGEQGLQKSEDALRRSGGLAVPLLLEQVGSSDAVLDLLIYDLLNRHHGWEVLPSTLGFWNRARRPVEPELEARARQEFRAERAARELHTQARSALARRSWLALSETRFAKWLGRVLRLDFGISLFAATPVRSLIFARLRASFVLQLPSLILVLLFGTALGIFEARRIGTRGERVVSTLGFLLYATPVFFVGTLLIHGLGGLLPIHGLLDGELKEALRAGRLNWWSGEILADYARHAFIPVFLLGYGQCIVISRYLRASLVAAAGEEHVFAARARGLPERTIFVHHVLRRGLVPLATLFGMLVPVLVGGSVIVESLCGIPGLGELAWSSALSRDLPVTLGLLTLVAMATMLGYFVSDLLLFWLDPRSRRR